MYFCSDPWGWLIVSFRPIHDLIRMRKKKCSEKLLFNLEEFSEYGTQNCSMRPGYK